ncbi:DUF58 domain-containing protein [Salinispira pacifica]|uniref:VWFA domain-containing protein n=1 Tax=Salinispira pacifica TaxID=1307761 RepID=V5WK46_9SPIO|nr:DUF58 domain-containing protein [Salinispira pacifica]AHC16187.1 hypothetical protein L21SP2_2837 [Salinispira pacifica]
MNAARLFARVKNLELLSSKLVESLLSGNYRSVFKGPGIEFSEVREYVEGDDPRLIDWNVTSRMNQVYTKTFREEREIVLFLLVDLSASVFSAAGSHTLRETADLLFTIFTFAAINNNDQVGAVFFTEEIEHWVSPMKGRKHALRLIQDMIRYKPKGTGSNLGLAIKTTGEALKRRGICVVLSDFKSSGYWRDLSILAKRHDVIAVRLTSPEEVDFPATGLIKMQDAETGRTLLGLGSNRRFRKKYQEYWAQQRRQWFRECQKRGVSPIEIQSNEDPILKLFQFFQRRKRRR